MPIKSTSQRNFKSSLQTFLDATEHLMQEYEAVYFIIE